MAERSVVIEPRSGLARVNLGELWAYRDLAWILLLRDVRVRYKQTAFGAGWALLQPLLLIGVFTVFLGRLADVPSDGVPYALFACCGLVPWTFFASATAAAAGSLVENERLVSKVYFPRLLMPVASASSYALDFVIGQLLVGILIVANDQPPRWQSILVPALGVGVLAAALAFGIGLSALNVRYRDVRYAIPFGIQVLLFLTPVVYPTSLIDGAWQYVYAINPMAGLVDLFRWALLGTPHLPAGALAVSFSSGVALIAAGFTYFDRVERSFADVI